MVSCSEQWQLDDGLKLFNQNNNNKKKFKPRKLKNYKVRSLPLRTLGHPYRWYPSLIVQRKPGGFQASFLLQDYWANVRDNDQSLSSWPKGVWQAKFRSLENISILTMNYRPCLCLPYGFILQSIKR